MQGCAKNGNYKQAFSYFDDGF
ncbi:hypothetical protein DN752_00710 [Echinicola strongylocentroti]|uniref:Uncharacterized protein n=1 Tax=Echinicola strongylocentroti TaxID=1795355 RepID=A0A2Z4IRS3_9BACT|nr:hypothetical protein DN752_00710 [Echinicola strongylocentroti]